MRALGEDNSVVTDVLGGQPAPRAQAQGASAGPTLGDIAGACRLAGKRLPPGLALSAVHDAALELAVVHASVGGTHGLLCDQSIAIDLQGAAHLVDEGLFRAADPHRAAAAVSARVAAYRSPEQQLRGQFPDSRSDVYALAAVLHELLSGRRTAARNTGERAALYLQSTFLPPSALNLALGPQVDEVVLRALSADPSRRYATAVDFAVALRRAAAGLFWRPALRAQFVAALFPDWHEREVVLGVLIPMPVRRSLRSAPPPARNAERAADSEPGFAQSDEVVLCEPLEAPVRFEMAGDFEDWDEGEGRARPIRAVVLGLVAIGLAGLWHAHLPLWDYERLAARALVRSDAKQVEAAPRRALSERQAAVPPARVAEASPRTAAEPAATERPAVSFGFVGQSRCGPDPVPPLRAAPCGDPTPRLKAVARPHQTVKRNAAGKHRAVASASASKPRRGRAK